MGFLTLRCGGFVLDGSTATVERRWAYRRSWLAEHRVDEMPQDLYARFAEASTGRPFGIRLRPLVASAPKPDLAFVCLAAAFFVRPQLGHRIRG